MTHYSRLRRFLQQCVVAALILGGAILLASPWLLLLWKVAP